MNSNLKFDIHPDMKEKDFSDGLDSLKEMYKDEEPMAIVEDQLNGAAFDLAKMLFIEKDSDDFPYDKIAQMTYDGAKTAEQFITDNPQMNPVEATLSLVLGAYALANEVTAQLFKNIEASLSLSTIESLKNKAAFATDEEKKALAPAFLMLKNLRAKSFPTREAILPLLMEHLEKIKQYIGE